MPRPPYRKIAKEQGKTRYCSAYPCINGHTGERYVSNGACVKCSTEMSHKWHIENKEKRSLKGYQWRKENPDYHKKYSKVYLQDNLEKHARNQAKRKAAKLKATFGNEELNDLVFNEAYKLAKLREYATGVKHHVDHIVPLQGSNVCGFHSWNNIRVVTATENWNKSNKIVEDLF